MKNSIFTGAALVMLGSSPVFATELSPVNWTGYYVGAGIGQSFATSKVDYAHSTGTCSNNNYGSDAGGGCGGTQNYATSLSHDMSNVTGNIHGGYNWQFNSLIVGIEPSLAIKQQDKKHHEVISSAFGDTLDVRTEQNYTANLRANIGMPIHDVLVYVTGGASAGRVKTSITQLAIGTSQRVFENSQTKIGYTLGGGVKYHLSHNWLVGGELLYVDLGKSSLSAPRLVMPGGLTYPDTQVKTRNTSGIAQLNLTYQF